MKVWINYKEQAVISSALHERAVLKKRTNRQMIAISDKACHVPKLKSLRRYTTIRYRSYNANIKHQTSNIKHQNSIPAHPRRPHQRWPLFFQVALLNSLA